MEFIPAPLWRICASVFLSVCAVIIGGCDDGSSSPPVGKTVMPTSPEPALNNQPEHAKAEPQARPDSEDKQNAALPDRQDRQQNQNPTKEQEPQAVIPQFNAIAETFIRRALKDWNKTEPLGAAKDEIRWEASDALHDIKRTDSIEYPIVGEIQVNLVRTLYMSVGIGRLTDTETGHVIVRIAPKDGGWAFVSARFVGDEVKTYKAASDVAPSILPNDTRTQIDKDFSQEVSPIFKTLWPQN